MMRALAILVFCAVTAEAQTVTVNPMAPSPGAPIVVTVSNGPGSIYDWITIVPVGSADNAYTGIWFLNGTSIPPSVGLTSASFPIPAPSSPGTYEVRWLASGYYARLATSGPITVGSASPLLLVNGDSNSSSDYMSGADNWTVQVAQGLGLPLNNMAVAGKYSDGVLIDLPVMQAQHAAICMVMIGGNDMAASVEHAVVSALAGYLGRMRQIVVGLVPACGKVVILTPPFTLHPLEVARFGAWVDGLRELAAELGVKLIDVYSYMRAVAAVKTFEQFGVYYLQPAVDRYHLSASGHALIASLVLQQSR